MSKYTALKTADRNGYIRVAEKDWLRLGILNHVRDYNNKIKGCFLSRRICYKKLLLRFKIERRRTPSYCVKNNQNLQLRSSSTIKFIQSKTPRDLCWQGFWEGDKCACATASVRGNCNHEEDLENNLSSLLLLNSLIKFKFECELSVGM